MSDSFEKRAVEVTNRSRNSFWPAARLEGLSGEVRITSTTPCAAAGAATSTLSAMRTIRGIADRLTLAPALRR